MSTIKTKIQSRMRDLHKEMIVLHTEGETKPFNEKNIEWNALDWVLELIEQEESHAVEPVVRAEEYDSRYERR